MLAPIYDPFVDHTKPLVRGGNLKIRLTGSIPDRVTGAIRQGLERLDADLGIDFRLTKNRAKADVVIQYRDIEPTAWARPDDGRWYVELQDGGLHRIYGKRARMIVNHEMGHVLGFYHGDQGLMNGYGLPRRGYFARPELELLQSVWGVEN